MNPLYNIPIPRPYREITFSEVKDLPVFGAEVELFEIGHKALFVMECTTREKMLEYTWENLRAPIIETVEDDEGIITFQFQMFKVIGE